MMQNAHKNSAQEGDVSYHSTLGIAQTKNEKVGKLVCAGKR